MKTRVAVLFGGRSPEHDVSIVTGLQALQALDPQQFDAFPVYIGLDGLWLVGDKLRQKENYLPLGSTRDELDEVTLDLRPGIDGIGRLIPNKKRGLFGSVKPIEFDVALFVFHGMFGEDGRIQSLFEIANVPFTGMRSADSAIAMDKVSTKRILAGSGVGVLPSTVIRRAKSGLLPSEADLAAQLSAVTFPVIVKPVHLGSSIGVSRANSVAEVRAALVPIFKLDTQALIEPFVENLVEYNVAVRRSGDEILVSAIERPKSGGELLDFRAKYCSGSGGKTGTKSPGAISQGLLQLTREINPALAEEQQSKLVTWAKESFRALGANGSPRIDFLSNSATGEIWFNEINPIPGSFGYFLWEASSKPILFGDLLAALINEAFELHKHSQIPADPTLPEARLFKHG